MRWYVFVHQYDDGKQCIAITQDTAYIKEGVSYLVYEGDRCDPALFTIEQGSVRKKTEEEYREDRRTALRNKALEILARDYETVCKDTDNRYLAYQKRKEANILTADDSRKYSEELARYKQATERKRERTAALATMTLEELEAFLQQQNTYPV